MRYSLLYALAILVGVTNAVQPGMFATLQRGLEQPLLAAFIIHLVGLVTLLALVPILGIAWPASGRASGIPWWAWLGGVLGAVYVLATAYLADRLGAAVFIGVTVTVTIAMSVVIDHLGLGGFERHAANLPRVMGAALMIVGVILVARY